MKSFTFPAIRAAKFVVSKRVMGPNAGFPLHEAVPVFFNTHPQWRNHAHPRNDCATSLLQFHILTPQLAHGLSAILSHEHAAIYMDDLTGDVPGLVRRQKPHAVLHPPDTIVSCGSDSKLPSNLSAIEASWRIRWTRATVFTVTFGSQFAQPGTR